MANRKSFAQILTGMVVLLLCAQLAVASATPSIGQVTLVIGVGNRVAPDGQKTLLRKGDSLQEGDGIETGANGHVHVRFVDGALVSVRPGSRLAIEAYRKDENGPSGVIRFKLEAGTVRSVTGQWGEADHDRFRLNTPIAAIGIRGTDFVVQSEAERVRAVVQSGAIVMAPLDGAQCQQSGLGVCNTAAAIKLSAEMGDVMLELRHRQPAPELIPLRDLLPAERLKEGAAVKTGPGETKASVVQLENNVSDNFTKVHSSMIASVVDAVASRSSPGATTSIDGGSQVQARLDSGLVWARMYPAWVGDSLSKGFSEVKEGRHVTVGSSTGQYLLLRSGSEAVDMRPVFAAGLGKIQFDLLSAQANLLRNGTVDAMQVKSGALVVDFSRRNFDASLAVSHDATGVVNMGAQGQVDRYTGIMLGGDIKGDGRVTGALSTTGRDAALAFERQIDQGLVSGVTLWGR